jgi:ATP/maltotriose-dependent transcriptional regulator MalT
LIYNDWLTSTLLQTKLFVPPLRPHHVPRPDLVKRLDDGLFRGCSLTLISAPAGYGKSTYDIYGKLGVHIRLQAVTRARELNLLPSS